jgi:hypothetical protein
MIFKFALFVSLVALLSYADYSNLGEVFATEP